MWGCVTSVAAGCKVLGKMERAVHRSAKTGEVLECFDIGAQDARCCMAVALMGDERRGKCFVAAGVSLLDLVGFARPGTLPSTQQHEVF